MRCGDCRKFVGQEAGDPETDLESTGVTITGSIAIQLLCMECGTALKEAQFDVDHSIEGECPCLDGDGECKEGHELSLEVGACEATDRAVGQGRGRKTFYGYRLQGEIRCVCGSTYAFVVEDDIQASSMDEVG